MLGLAYFSAPLWAWFVVFALFLLGCGASWLWFVPLIALGGGCSCINQHA